MDSYIPKGFYPISTVGTNPIGSRLYLLRSPQRVLRKLCTRSFIYVCGYTLEQLGEADYGMADMSYTGDPYEESLCAWTPLEGSTHLDLSVYREHLRKRFSIIQRLTLNEIGADVVDLMCHLSV